jgi:hypothetical protein
MSENALQDLIRPARAILAQAGAARIRRATEVELMGVSFSTKEGVLSAMAVGTKVKEGRPMWQLRIDPRGWVCDCPDWVRRGGGCKHVTALALRVLSGSGTASGGRFPQLGESRRAYFSIRDTCQDPSVFDQDCLVLVKELAKGREIEPWDFVRAARTVALSNGKEI